MRDHAYYNTCSEYKISNDPFDILEQEILELSINDNYLVTLLRSDSYQFAFRI